MAQNRITALLGIQYPIIQGGMVWNSGYKLASAVSNAGGLGLLGAGSMYPDVLRTHIQKCKQATDKPFGVNVSLLYPDLQEVMDIIVEEGVQMGTRFIASAESSAHETFKNRVIQVEEGDTIVTLKELAPVRMIKNEFYQGIENLYKKGADVEELRAYLSKGRSKKGMFEGDLVEGELEAGQVAGLIRSIEPVEKIISTIMIEFKEAQQKNFDF